MESVADRRYSREEVAKILRLATERQLNAPERSGGLGEDEVRAVAREIGIDERLLEEVLTEWESGMAEPPKRHWLWGLPLSHEAQTVVPGGVNEEVWEETVADLRRTLGEEGKTEIRGNTREWVGKYGGLVDNELTVLPHPQGLRIRSTLRGEGLAVVYGLLALLPTFILVAATRSIDGISDPVGAAVIGVSAAAFLVASRRLSGASFHRLVGKMQGAVGRLARRASAQEPDVRTTLPPESVAEVESNPQESRA